MTPRQKALKARLPAKKEKRRRRLIRQSGYDPDYIDGLARFYRTPEGKAVIASVNAIFVEATKETIDNNDGTFTHRFSWDAKRGAAA